MSTEGYTPVFGTVFTGTLHGRWPDTGLWLCLLALSNKRGEIDCTPHYIASVTGLPVADVVACINRFLEPDPHSRTPAEQGRRLIPLNGERDWGWRIVNHEVYREKARLQAKSAREVASGQNASRMDDRRRPPETAESENGPPLTASDPLSNAYSDSNSEKNSDRERAARPPETAESERAVRAPTAKRLPETFALTPERQATARAEAVNPEREFARFCDHWRAASGSTARKHDWDAAWRNWCRKAKDMVPRPNGKGSFEERMAALKGET